MKGKPMGLRALKHERDFVASSVAMLPHLSDITLRTYWNRYGSWDVDHSLRGQPLREALIAWGEERIVFIDEEIAELREAESQQCQS